MRVTSIRATDLFAFDDLALTDLGPRLTVVVGPNGAGKTNLIRILQMTQQAVTLAASPSAAAMGRLVRYTDARRDGGPAAGAPKAIVGLELTAPRERQLMTEFVRAALVSSIARDAGGVRLADPVLRWVDDQVTEDTLEPLLGGDVIVNVPRGQDEPRDLAYRFRVDASAFVVPLTGGLDGIRVEGDDRLSGWLYDTMATRLGLRASSLDQAKAFAMSSLLPEVGHVTGLTVDPISAQPEPEAYRQFSQAMGAEPDERRIHGFASVLDVIIRGGIALLSEAREPPRATYAATDATVGDADRSALPLRLFRLKNGDAADRQRFEAIRSIYGELTGSPTFDLTGAWVPASAKLASDEVLQIKIVLPERTHDIPLEFAGMGAWEAVALSALIAGEDDRLLLLDEPAVNLHPGAQRRLLSRLLDADTAQTIIVTHSPYLVPAGDRAQLAQVVRIDRVDGVSRVHRLASGTDAGRSSWIKELAGSADARSLLFAAGAILVEGETEAGALPVWFEHCATAVRCGGPEQLNLQVHCVGGDRNFHTYLEICQAFGVPWCVICDGAALDAGRPEAGQILHQLVAAGAASPELRAWLEAKTDPAGPTFEATRDVARAHGIFTLAQGARAQQEAFEAYLQRVAPEELAAAQEAEPRSKPRLGRQVAERVSCPEAVDELYASVLGHLGIAAASAAAVPIALGSIR